MSQHPIYDWCLDVTTTMSQPEETRGVVKDVSAWFMAEVLEQ